MMQNSAIILSGCGEEISMEKGIKATIGDRGVSEMQHGGCGLWVAVRRRAEKLLSKTSKMQHGGCGLWVVMRRSGEKLLSQIG